MKNSSHLYEVVPYRKYITRGKYTKLEIKGQMKEKYDILKNNNKSMISMQNLEIINSRSIIKATLHCIELA
ncbi:hypothetical protein ACS94_10410, partial [Bacillus cereus]